MYTSENDLVRDFSSHLATFNCPFETTNFASEFGYHYGRVDVIAVNSDRDLISFEAKLSRWRQALNQAYRRTAFSHYSYVVVPVSIKEKVLAYWQEFDIRGVGLCTVGPAGVEIEIEARRHSPLQSWLTDEARQFIS